MSSLGKSWKIQKPRMPWTREEDALVSDYSKSALELSSLIDRTVPAIKSRRRQLSGAVRMSHATKASVLPKFHSDSHLLGKSCLSCLQFLPRDAFGMQTSGTSRESNCRQCKRDFLRSRREADPARTSAESHARERAIQAQKKIEARNHNKEWTGPELELISRKDLSSGQLATMLGRSLYAIKSQRFLLNKNDLKYEVAGVPIK